MCGRYIYNERSFFRERKRERAKILRRHPSISIFNIGYISPKSTFNDAFIRNILTILLTKINQIKLIIYKNVWRVFEILD